MRQPLSGWLGHAAPFDFAPSYRPARGIARFVCGTPSVLAMSALECGVDVFAAAEPAGGMAALRAKSIALAELFIAQVEARCAGLGLTLVDAARRLAARQPGELRPRRRLPRHAGADRARRDRRLPRRRAERTARGDDADPSLAADLLRFGFTPLYTRYVDAWDAAAQLHDVLQSGAWRDDALRAARQGDMMTKDASAPSPPAEIVAGEAAKLDFSKEMSYGDYLHLDELLGAQHLRSGAHDEMLFIVQHQVTELWMKLLLHELRAAIAAVAGDELQRAFKMLARVSKIMEQMVHAWDVLATMTPPEYSTIRPSLASSSGFQSWQYRQIEFLLGNKNAAMLKPHEHRPDLLAEVQAAHDAPSLYDEALRLLARRGLPVPAIQRRARLVAALRRRARASSRRGSSSTATPRRTGTCTSSARS